ncbi:MAG: VOC family protein [Sphingomonadales bacterium]|nr:MAG: VOC family protein [Sphingomonadales bacterium]
MTDIFAAMAQWTGLFGVGPFFLYRIGDGARPGVSLYRGKPWQFEGLIALSFDGDLQIELIQQSNDTPSVYTETLATRGAGFHHFKWEFEDYDAAVAHFRSRGIEAAMEIESPGVTRVTYFDTVAELGHFVELGDPTPAFRESTAKMRQICAAWDGNDAVREMARF